MAAFDASRFVPPLGEPVLPRPGERNVLVTSALPYVNNVPHLGNIIGCVLSADVYARYLRQTKVNCIYICGTDEYGTATETKALAEGLSCQAICDKYNAIHTQVYKWFDCKFDYFGRTTTPAQTEIAQDIFLNLYKNGFISQNSVTQLYCETCPKFLADRFVEGTCPRCHSEKARGDQCDSCDALLDPIELINPRCKVCKSTPIPKDSRHIFLDLDKLSPDLQQYLDRESPKWGAGTVGITESWMKKGLHPRCISRDLKWGTPVPLEEFKDKVFYVWFDAPIGYISITANYTPEWRKWWKNPKEVESIEFMGKDNVPFHTVMFPASQIGTREEWTLVNNLSVTDYLNYGDFAFSKTNGTGVFGDAVQELNITPDCWRYYLLTNRPELGDTAFSWEDFQSKINNELASALGNQINRVTKFIWSDKKFNGVIPALGELTEADHAFVREVSEHLTAYHAAFEKIKIKEAIRLAHVVAGLGNSYLQSQKAWDLYEADVARCCTVIRIASEFLVLLGTINAPFMPGLASKLFKTLNIVDADEIHPYIPSSFELTPSFFGEGHRINEPYALVRRIADEELPLFKARFGETTRTEDQAAAAAAASKAKKGAKSSGSAGAGSAGPSSKAAAEPPNMCPLDLRVGIVLAAEPVANSDKLYKMQVDVGEATPRQIVGGLQKFYTVEQLVGRRVMAVCNLKEAKLAGEKSEGMLLAGVTGDGDTFKCSLLRPVTEVEGYVPGTPAFCEGQVAWQVDRKIKASAFKEVTLVTNNDGLVTLNGAVLTCAGTPLTPDNPEIPAGSTVQ